MSVISQSLINCISGDFKSLCYDNSQESQVSEEVEDILKDYIVKTTDYFIGTCGWKYNSWADSFYEDVLVENWLDHYANVFNTVEINTTFYDIPSPKIWKKWKVFLYLKNLSGDKFTFVLQMNKYATHMKSLKDPEAWWPRFWNLAKILQPYIGPILFRLKKSFKYTKNNYYSLKHLSTVIDKDIPISFEFGHLSWDPKEQELIDLFKENNWSWVIAHTTDGWNMDINEALVINRSFVYIRLTGTTGISTGYYPDKILDFVVELMERAKDNDMVSYAFFSNTDDMEPGGILPSATYDAQNLQSLIRPDKELCDWETNLL